MQLLICQVISASGISTSTAAWREKAERSDWRLTEGKAPHAHDTVRGLRSLDWLGNASVHEQYS